jgi:hypothetical protein
MLNDEPDANKNVKQLSTKFILVPITLYPRTGGRSTPDIPPTPFTKMT